MATYVSLISFTDQGARSIKDTVNRVHSAKELAKSMGGELREALWTVGDHDLVAISEFPDTVTGMAFLASIAALGNARTSTMQALNEEEMTEALGKMA